MELDDLHIGVNFEEIEEKNLEDLAEKVQDALFGMTGPRDSETVAQLLEAFARKVREGEY